MRVIVCGGRHYSDSLHLSEMLHVIQGGKGEFSQVMTGGAPGVDTLATRWALKNGIETCTFEADWDAHGRAAGPIRNQQMLDDGKPDLVIAFPGGRGTADMVRRAEAAGIDVVRVMR